MTTRQIEQFPHCDSRVLHAPSECEFCDGHQDWQELRQAWGIAFTGHPSRGGLPQCGKRMRDSVPSYGGEVRCKQPRGHEDECRPYPASDILPCPADAARPAGAGNDHRRWGGNKPTGATGNPAWPAETSASVMMYGDKGGRENWPWPERARRRLARPFGDWRMRRRGYVKEDGLWVFRSRR